MTFRRWVGVFAAWILALSVGSLRAQEAAGGAQTPAANGDREVAIAREQFKAGVEYYREGDLQAALVAFKRAYAAAPNFRLLYNLGQVSQELREYPDASRYYEQYLREGGDTVDWTRRQEVELALAKVRARIAELQLSSDVDGVEYFIDDVSIGRSPFERPVLVSAGRHRVDAVAPAFGRVTEMVDAGGGEILDVRLRFGRAAAAAQAPAAAVRGRREPPPSRGLPAAVWLGIGTGALAIGTGVFALLAADDGAEYRAALQRKTSRAELDSLHDDAAGKALVTDILLGATLASGAVALYFALRDSDDSVTERAGARLDLGPASLHLRGAF